MTNEEAIQWLDAIKKYYIHGGDEAYDKKRMKAIDKAIQALEQQPRWIPVSERLPEGEGWYLISLGDKTYGGADVDMYCKGWVKYGNHVLAWMPLPEPYRESEDKE